MGSTGTEEATAMSVTPEHRSATFRGRMKTILWCGVVSVPALWIYFSFVD